MDHDLLWPACISIAVAGRALRNYSAMMVKTPGRVCYEAYAAFSFNKSLVSGTELPAWEDQMPRIREAWESAALSTIKFAADQVQQLPIRP
jgi:hypothetical protein